MLYRKARFVTGICTILFCFFLSVAGQENSCGELQKLIDKTYGFKPSKLSESEKTTKSAEMDVVWKKVKADKEKLLPCIKQAMKKPEADGFFIFDASNLLISVDPSDEHKELLIKSYMQVDFEDVDLAYWVPQIAKLGYEGFDTSAAGRKWIDAANPSYPYPDPKHPGIINKYRGTLIIYGSMDEKYAIPALSEIALKKDHIYRGVAIALLTHHTSPEVYKFLQKIDQKELSEQVKGIVQSILSRPTLLRPRKLQTDRETLLKVFQKLVDGDSSEFMKMAEDDPQGDRDVIVLMKKEDLPLLRKVRRYFAAWSHPDSAVWYSAFTKILLTITNNEYKKNKK